MVYPLVEFETNKYILDSFHQKKYQEKFNLDMFIDIIKNQKFKEHKDFNQISNFFQPSIEILAKEIIDDLNENELKRKDDRLEVFLDDLKNTIQFYKSVLIDFDLKNIEYFYNSTRKNIMSNQSNLDLAKGDITNLLQEYQLIEKSIISKIIQKMSDLVSKNYIFVLFDFWFENDDSVLKINLIKEKIEKYYSLLLVILMNKGISKKEITELFKKLCSYSNFHQFISRDGIYFKCDYPIDLENNFGNLAEYRFQLMNIVNNLTIEERFNRFIELLYEEKDCHYIFNVLNTELDSSNNANEIQYGNIIYYNEQIFKSKGYRNNLKIDEKDKFRNEKEVKVIVSFKTKRYFSNISTLKVRNIIENNISLLKLFGNNNSNEKEDYFKPSPSKMDISYSHFVLDEDFYIISGSQTIYDGDFTFKSNKIYEKIYTKDEYQKKLNKFLTHLNYKQIENTLTSNDELILQSLKKLKLSLESNSYSDLLLHTWNGFEFLAKSFNNKKEKIKDLIILVYSFIYTNEHYRYDLNDKSIQNKIKKNATHLFVYAYTYRNKLVHSHLLEDSLMISFAKGLNIIFKELLSLIIDKIIIVSDFNIDDIFNQLNSDLSKRNSERKK